MAEFDRIVQDLKTNDALLRDVDKNPHDHRFSKTEVAAYITGQWNDYPKTDLSRLAHQVTSAAQLQQDVDKLPMHPHAQDIAHMSPRDKLLANIVAPAIGHKEQAGTGELLAANYLELRLKEYGAPETDIPRMAQEVAEGVQNVQWLNRVIASNVNTIDEAAKNGAMQARSITELESEANGAATATKQETKRLTADELHTRKLLESEITKSFPKDMPAAQRKALLAAALNGPPEQSGPVQAEAGKNDLHLTPEQKKSIDRMCADMREYNKQPPQVPSFQDIAKALPAKAVDTPAR
jgi:hypothetical protein